MQPKPPPVAVTPKSPSRRVLAVTWLLTCIVGSNTVMPYVAALPGARVTHQTVVMGGVVQSPPNKKAPWSAVAPPILPGAGWDGTVGSGGGTPTDPARTQAKAILVWDCVPLQTVAAGGTLVVRVQGSAAGGGLTNCTFRWEGGTAVVVTQQDGFGGYSVTLSPASNIAHDGMSRLWCTANPVSGSVLTRSISLDIVIDNGTKTNLHHSYVDNPYMVDSVHGSDVSGDGTVAKPFASIKAAIIYVAAHSTNNDMSGSLFYCNPGNYFPDFYTGGSTVNCAFGWCTVMPNPNNPGAVFNAAKTENYSPRRLHVKGFSFDGRGGSSGQWLGGGGGSEGAARLWIDGNTFVGNGPTTNQIGQDGWGQFTDGMYFTGNSFTDCSYGMPNRENILVSDNTRLRCSGDAYCRGANSLKARNSQKLCVQWDAVGQHVDDDPFETQTFNNENMVEVDCTTDGFIGIGLSFVLNPFNVPMRDCYWRNRTFREDLAGSGGGFDRLVWPMNHCVFEQCGNIDHTVSFNSKNFTMSESMVIGASGINVAADVTITGSSSGATAKVLFATQTASPLHVYGRLGTFTPGEPLTATGLTGATFTSISYVMGDHNEFTNCAFAALTVESDDATLKAFILARTTFTNCNFADNGWKPGTGATTVSTGLYLDPYNSNFYPDVGMPRVARLATVTTDAAQQVRTDPTAIGGYDTFVPQQGNALWPTNRPAAPVMLSLKKPAIMHTVRRGSIAA